MSVSDARRAEYEKLRTKVYDDIEKFEVKLDEDGHPPECALRCFEDEDICSRDHACPVCGDDE
jgi:hypothetical protein